MTINEQEAKEKLEQDKLGIDRWWLEVEQKA
jgi:hypothetical protein